MSSARLAVAPLITCLWPARKNSQRRSDGRDPTHTFDSPGCYNVALTVTDDHGGSARGNVVILVDRDQTEPIVRVISEAEEADDADDLAQRYARRVRQAIV